jgi:ElaB/YqjD/DUF883 family membrane-anchored ribosome-binding protein
MSQRTTEKEFEVLKGDFMNLLESVVNSFKKKLEATRVRGEEVAEDLKDKIEQHPGTTALIGGTVAFGLGVLATKLWCGRNKR